MSVHRALLVLLSVICFFAATAQSPQSFADVQIASVSGCVDVYPITVNCSVATTTLLIKTVAGFPAFVVYPYEWIYIQAELGNYQYFTSTQVWLDTSDPTNSSVFVNVTATAYYPHITGSLISVSFIDYYSAGRPTSPPFAGFSYHFEGPPTLTSIAGCDGSGQSTLNCVPDSSTIELTGSGLLWYSSANGVLLNIGEETSWPLSNLLRVVNDSYATLPLAWIYGSLLKPHHYAGVLLPINFTSRAYSRTGLVEYSYTTNSLQISFIPLPPPCISTWWISRCNQSNSQNFFNLSLYSNCLPSVSQLYLLGGYLYDAQVTVGGVPCPASSSNSPNTFFCCFLPNFDFDPSIAYDVVVYNDAGNTTFAGLAQYTASPTLIGIDPCVDRGEGYEQIYGVKCPVGTTITLRGSRFPAADAVTVKFAPYYYSPRYVNLLAPTLINSTTITATLPALNGSAVTAVYGQRGTVQALFTSSDSNSTSNTITNTLYMAANAPTITAVASTMCDSVSPLQLTNCRAMAVITVVGSNLAQRNSMLTTSVGAASLGPNYLLASNSSLDFSTNNSLVFTLDYFDADTNVNLQPNVVYTIFITNTADWYWQQSNAFRLSLTYGAADTSTTSLSNRLSSGAIAGIVIAAVVVAVLLVLVVVWLARHQLSKKSAGGELSWSMRGAQSSSDDYKDVELN